MEKPNYYCEEGCGQADEERCGTRCHLYKWGRKPVPARKSTRVVWPEIVADRM